MASSEFKSSKSKRLLLGETYWRQHELKKDGRIFWWIQEFFGDDSNPPYITEIIDKMEIVENNGKVGLKIIEINIFGKIDWVGMFLHFNWLFRCKMIVRFFW